MKILIIDDEPLVRRSLLRALKAKGHEGFEAPDGEEGLRVWCEVNPDLVFLDVLMPGLSGPEVLVERQNHQASGKVILMSAYSGEHNMETAQQMGADLFIPKPFEDIFEVIRIGEELCQ